MHVVHCKQNGESFFFSVTPLYWMSIKPIEVPDVFPKKLLGGGGVRGPNKKRHFLGGGGGALLV